MKFGIRGILPVLGLAMLYGRPVAAQSGDQSVQERKWNSDAPILRECISIPCASKLAHARYETLRLERHLRGGLNWGQFFGVAALFPALRSDRMYLLLYNWRWPNETSKPKNLVLCYQRTNNMLKLVYRIRYEYPSSVAPYVRTPSTFLEFLQARGFVPVGPISSNAKNDMSTVRDYVWYGVVPYTSSLEIYMAADILVHDTGRYGPRGMKSYQINYDPFTGKEFKDLGFYRKYGLPIAKRELDLLKRSSK